MNWRAGGTPHSSTQASWRERQRDVSFRTSRSERILNRNMFGAKESKIRRAAGRDKAIQVVLAEREGGPCGGEDSQCGADDPDRNGHEDPSRLLAHGNPRQDFAKRERF